MATNLALDNSRRHAEQLVDTLVDNGPLTGAECCKLLGWTRGRFDTALALARREVCSELDLVIPHPTPDTGWRYQVTLDWEPVERGASYLVGMIETRLRGLHRDVRFVRPHLTRGTTEWRRANFLEKHLGHIIGTLKEINDG